MTSHPLPRDANMLGNCFANFSVQHIWMEGNMCANYVASEGIRVHKRIVWEAGFPQRLLELALRNVSEFMLKGYNR